MAIDFDLVFTDLCVAIWSLLLCLNGFFCLILFSKKDRDPIKIELYTVIDFDLAFGIVSRGFNHVFCLILYKKKRNNKNRKIVIDFDLPFTDLCVAF